MLCIFNSLLTHAQRILAKPTQVRHRLSVSKGVGGVGGSIAQWLAYLLPDSPTQGSIPSIPIVDVTEVNQRCCLAESGHWLENLDWTHLVLASGKLVLQKEYNNHWWAEHFLIRMTSRDSSTMFLVIKKFKLIPPFQVKFSIYWLLSTITKNDFSLSIHFPRSTTQQLG